MKFFIIAFLPVLVYGQTLTKLEWNDCGSPAVDFYEIDANPMPIVHPGSFNLTFSSNFKRKISGYLRNTITLKKTISQITLPITCYMVNGNYIGSCTYNDFCLLLIGFLSYLNQDDCPSILNEIGLDCTCPFKINTGLTSIKKTITLLTSIDQISFFSALFSAGQFYIKMDTSDNIGSFACIEINFSVKPKI